MPALNLIRLEKYPFHFPEFDNVSQECRNLISAMIVYKPELRLTSKEVIEHPWFKLKKKPNVRLCNKVWAKLSNYRGQSMLRKTVMNILVKMSTDEEVKEMTRQFKAIDTDGSGTICIAELKAYMKKQRHRISDDAIRKMMDELDFIPGSDGEINYSEFLAATLDMN